MGEVSDVVKIKHKGVLVTQKQRKKPYTRQFYLEWLTCHAPSLHEINIELFFVPGHHGRGRCGATTDDVLYFEPCNVFGHVFFQCLFCILPSVLHVFVHQVNIQTCRTTFTKQQDVSFRWSFWWAIQKIKHKGVLVTQKTKQETVHPPILPGITYMAGTAALYVAPQSTAICKIVVLSVNLELCNILAPNIKATYGMPHPLAWK